MALDCLKELKVEKLKEELEEHLRGDCCCDYITKKDWMNIIDDFNKWSEMAKNGDAYYYDEHCYKLEMVFEIHVWQNEIQRDKGEPIYMKPTCSNTDIEAIKREVEHYDIEAGGCIEICEVNDKEPIFHYEKGEWTEIE